MGTGNPFTVNDEIPSTEILKSSKKHFVLKKICQKCKLEYLHKIREIVPSTASTPLYSQFKRKKPCRCNRYEWNAYKINYFTVPQYFSSLKSEYIHVVEIRLRCKTKDCKSIFPLSISFTPLSIECHFGEYRKMEEWIKTWTINLNYDRLMCGYFSFFDVIEAESKKHKEEKKDIIHPNKKIYVLDLLWKLLLENAKGQEEVEEIVPEKDCESCKEKAKFEKCQS